MRLFLAQQKRLSSVNIPTFNLIATLEWVKFNNNFSPFEQREFLNKGRISRSLDEVKHLKLFSKHAAGHVNFPLYSGKLARCLFRTTIVTG